MPEIVRRLNPPTMSSPPGYSHVVEVTGPARTVYFAGQLGIDRSGTFAVPASRRRPCRRSRT